MRRLPIIFALIASACVPVKPAVTPTPDSMLVYVEVADAESGLPVAGAAVRYWASGDVSSSQVLQTSAAGTTAFEVPTVTAASHMWVEASGYLPQERHVDASAGLIVRWRLQRLPPADPADGDWLPVPSESARRGVMCNFLNLRDSEGRVIFSSSLPALDTESQLDWIAREKAAGGTHYVVSIETGYPGYWVPIVQFWTAGRIEEWARSVSRIAKSGLTPIIFLHNGSPYPGDAYFRELCRWIVQHAPELVPRSLWVPAWEPRRAGDWTAAQFDSAVRIMRAELGQDAMLAFHGSPESHTFGDGHGTNPADPWNGLGEPDEWYTHAGREIDVLLFQTLYADDGKKDQWGDPTWWNRAADVAERFLPQGTPLPFLVGKHAGNPEQRNGSAHPDWFAGTRRQRGRPTLVAFESVAYGYVRGWVDEARVLAVADVLYGMGFRAFGNGTPTALRK